MAKWIALVLLASAVASLMVYKRMRRDRTAAKRERANREDRVSRAALAAADHRRAIRPLIELLDQEEYEQAMNAIEDLLARLTAVDANQLANYTVYAFEGMAQERTPQEVLRLYDSLRNKGAALAFAEKEGKDKEIAHVLAESLQYFQAPHNKAGVRDFIRFIEGDEPLLQKAREHYPTEFAEQLDYRAANSIKNWEYGSAGTELETVTAMVKKSLATS